MLARLLKGIGLAAALALSLAVWATAVRAQAPQTPHAEPVEAEPLLRPAEESTRTDRQG